MSDAGADVSWTGGHNPWAIALVVTLATFMEVLDTSIANVSLPHIAGSLSVTPDESTWVLTSYLVSNAVVLPVSGWLASRIGRKRFYMTCVAGFTGSSLLCGLAPTLPALIFFRVLQGAAGGGLAPSEQAIMADTFPAAKRGMAFAVYGMAVVLAPAIGPTLGGFITDHYSWRWIFFINVPVGVASLLLTSRVRLRSAVSAQRRRANRPDRLPRLRAHRRRARHDGGRARQGSGGQLVPVAAHHRLFDRERAVALVAFVLRARKRENPIVDVNLFRERNFATATVMMLALGLVLYGSTVLLPEYLQLVMGYSAQQAGMVLSPGGLVVLLLLPLVGALTPRINSRLLIGFGFALLSVSLFYMTRRLYPGMDFRTAIKLRAFQSAGLAFLFVPINTLIYEGIPPHRNNAVSGIVNLARNMGGDIGIAFVTTMAARRAQFHQVRLTDHTSRYDHRFVSMLDAVTRALEHSGASSLTAAQRALALLYRETILQATTLAYIDVLHAFALMSAVMIPVLWLAQRRPGAAPTRPAMPHP